MVNLVSTAQIFSTPIPLLTGVGLVASWLAGTHYDLLKSTLVVT